jgi:hypothetical protein
MGQDEEPPPTCQLAVAQIAGSGEPSGRFDRLRQVMPGMRASGDTPGWDPHYALPPVVIPIPGASRPASIRDSLLAGELALAADEPSAPSSAEWPRLYCADLNI